MHKLLNRNGIQPFLGCLANYHELLNDFRVKGCSCLFFEEISTSRIGRPKYEDSSHTQNLRSDPANSKTLCQKNHSKFFSKFFFDV